MKLFTIAKGTPGYLMDRTGFYKPFNVRKDLTFELENVVVDPLHPGKYGTNTIGHEFASKGYYGFVDETGNAKYRAKHTLFIGLPDVVVV
jgi:hypothetical protein